MDEPLSNLDAKLRVQMRSEIAQLHERLGATIIYVTHDQTEAMTLGTRIVVLKDGVIQQVDTPENLYNHPQNVFTAGFIGSPQMNFFDAAVRSDGSRVFLTIGDHDLQIPDSDYMTLIDGGYLGTDITLGVRPEDLRCVPAAAANDPNTISAKVNLYELLGAEVELGFDYNDGYYMAKASSDVRAHVGSTQNFKLNMNKAHYFDKESGKRIERKS